MKIFKIFSKALIIFFLAFIIGYSGSFIFDKFIKKFISQAYSLVSQSPLEKKQREKSTVEKSIKKTSFQEKTSSQEKTRPEKQPLSQQIRQGIVCRSKTANNQAQFYFKKDDIKLVLVDSQEKKLHGLWLDQKEFYYWQEGEKSGFKVEFKMDKKPESVQGMTGLLPGMNLEFTTKALESTNLSTLETSLKAKCKVKNLDQSLFSLPQGVSFNNFSGFNLPGFFGN
ncbi:MAG: hypothetical protein NZL96_02790 [Patescibacteria group bacterium]|nr:hypothetical protein [Patescibacteria group bacterium]